MAVTGYTDFVYAEDQSLNGITGSQVKYVPIYIITGIFTLGHAAYMALGAYTTAILTVRYGVHWLPALLAGGLIAILVAWLIGVPTLRLTGDYYAIASIGLGEAIRLILHPAPPAPALVAVGGSRTQPLERRRIIHVAAYMVARRKHNGLRRLVGSRC